MSDTHTLLSALPLPHGNGRTLGSEQAIRAVSEQADGSIQIHLCFPYPVRHLAAELEQNIQAALQRPVYLTLEQQILTRRVQSGVSTIKGVKNTLAVASGKGGVGKSTTTANLAVALAKMGARVGVLDADLYGPSQPAMLGVPSRPPEQQQGKFVPVRNADGIQVMSIGFLIAPEQAVVWRGPMLSQALQQLLFQSEWDDVDYLLIDLPPGTGDIQLTLAQKIPVTGAAIVTTPQDIALLDARKAVDMFEKVKIPIFGILENMSVHICSRCGHREALFGTDGGRHLAETLNLPLLGQLPLSLPVREAMDKGEAAALQAAHADIAAVYTEAAFALALAAAEQSRDYSSRFPKIVVE
ncbi:MAG: iron-sulfur cluster carrier protein ApbC [Conchiformibius sp.]|nr:iron-sulfur cluster carrier protein ApbC [Conchiformibius sp.]